MLWQVPRTHGPLCNVFSGRGGSGLCSGPVNHFPGAMAIGRSSSNSRALTIPITERPSEKVSILPLSSGIGEFRDSIVDTSNHLGALSLITAQLQETPSVPLESSELPTATGGLSGIRISGDSAGAIIPIRRFGPSLERMQIS